MTKESSEPRNIHKALQCGALHAVDAPLVIDALVQLHTQMRLQAAMLGIYVPVQDTAFEPRLSARQ